MISIFKGYFTVSVSGSKLRDIHPAVALSCPVLVHVMIINVAVTISSSERLLFHIVVGISVICVCLIGCYTVGLIDYFLSKDPTVSGGVKIIGDIVVVVYILFSPFAGHNIIGEGIPVANAVGAVIHI